MNLVHANLGVHRELKGNFHYSEGVELHLQYKERPRKQFSPLWMPCKARACLVRCYERHRNKFQNCGGPAKLIHVCLCIRRHIETVFIPEDVM